ncbi:MAG: hypothetical protein HY783_06080, partial [Chloroflexi bacterium]|nr:hypothetical protein [Chloroflexota bacterium]
MEYIPNEALTPELIPVPDASWDVIQDFALSFPGYTIHGSFDKCAEIANAQRRETLSDLRTFLFFEQRRWRHFGQVPDKEALSYIRSLVEEIRARVVETTRQKKIDIADYKEKLITQYWVYQKEVFPDVENHFERPYAPIGRPRPPVFHKHKEWENVITRLGASQEETSQLLGLVPEGERHKWFRSMNSSQALAQSVFGNLAVYGFLSSLTELLDDDEMALLGKAQVLPDNFGMEFKVDYLGEPRPTSLDGYIEGDYRVAIECKFTESEVGTCSRPQLTPADSNYDSEH